MESKSVLISIRPQWCELIANDEKTIEVRKSRPKLETPFKCYIYCTKQKAKHALHTYVTEPAFRDEYGTTNHWRSGEDIVDVNAHLPAYRHNEYLAEGKVIVEFVCDEIFQYSTGNIDGQTISSEEMQKQSCLTYDELSKYETSAEARDFCLYMVGLYGWHISALQIYDKPRKLSEFIVERYPTLCRLKRPPQSWCYIEEEKL